jgi:8-oxo-dGTP diphosphatase
MAYQKDPIHKAKKPALAVDVVLFTIKSDDLKVGFIKRDEEPFFGKYALPGKFVKYMEVIKDTAKRTLQLEGNVNPNNVFLDQLYTFGKDVKRDPRLHVITCVYYGLVDSMKLGNENKLIWYSVYNLPPLAFDHKDIVRYAIKRLRKKVLEGDFAFQLMSDEFTLSELQKVYEIILDEKLDKRNFRKKIKELHIIKDLKKQKRDGAHRPAALFSFSRKR